MKTDCSYNSVSLIPRFGKCITFTFSAKAFVWMMVGVALDSAVLVVFTIYFIESLLRLIGLGR